MKKYLILFAGLGIASFAKSQQLQSSSFYDLQGAFHNPAMAGTEGHGVLGVTYRTQWSSISGAPKTGTLFGSFDMPKHAIGLGGYLYNDQTGPISRTGLNLSFAKHIALEKGQLSIGLQANAQQYAIDVDKLAQSLGASDPTIMGGDNKYKFDAGFGAAYVSKSLTIGVSVAQLIQSKLDFYNGNADLTEEGKLYRHYYAHGSYNWKVDKNTVITPNFLMIYLPNAPLEFQGGARVEHNNLFWWGVSLRAKQSWMLSAGVRINKKFNVGYSFDIYTTPMSVYSQGTSAHEILLRYDFLK
jgi:type IX secretion system PorP/SprF family membrane protein